MVGRPELGTKCACASCAERFYDLNRSPAVCPKCGATQPPVAVRAARPVRPGPGSAYMSRRPPSVVAVEEPEPLAAVEEDAVEEDADEDEVDAEDLPEIDADDDGDVGPVIVRD
jgi:uncharacterized protein (TIGR02300 family)